MLDVFEIDWIETDLDDIYNYEDTEFYAFTEGSKLLYIGIAYHQDIINEIKNTLNAFRINEEEVKIWIGYIENTNYSKITKSIIVDVECLLIHLNQPTLNKQCKSSYTGRDNLIILSTGCALIKPCIKIEDSKFDDKCY